MKYTYVMSNGKELKLRLTSGECIEIENTYKKSILSYIQEESMTMMCTLLKYMVKEKNGEQVQNFSFKNAQMLFDEMIDSGMTLKQILMDVIYETLVISGFLEKEDWEEMKTAQTQASKKVTKKAVEKLNEI
ncbi:hypothetical protein IKS57_01955 [bacterium]|nr:hypothetical protein [bacterium]